MVVLARLDYILDPVLSKAKVGLVPNKKRKKSENNENRAVSKNEPPAPRIY